jgi:hypothetical protein
VIHAHERPVHRKLLPALEKCRGRNAAWSKKVTMIKHLGPLPRNRWKFRHTVAFLLDSQAKNP